MCGLILFSDVGESVDLSKVPDGQIVFGVGKLLFPNDGLSVEVVSLENRRYEGINILSERVVTGRYNEVLRALQELGMIVLEGQCQILLSYLNHLSITTHSEKSP